MHADHHLGLCQMIDTFQKYRQKQGFPNKNVLYLFGPTRLIAWLREYETVQPGLLKNVKFLNNDWFLPGATRSPEIEKSIKEAYGTLCINNVTNVSAKHCFQSYSVIIDHRFWGRIVYSGDTRPNAQLVKHGQNARLLIHEATFENDLLEEAKQKKHTTIGEALVVAKDIKAEHVLLTHFSQRYPDSASLPSSPKMGTKKEDDKAASMQVVLASDLMSIKLSSFWRMPYYQKTIQLAQEDHSEDEH